MMRKQLGTAAARWPLALVMCISTVFVVACCVREVSADDDDIVNAMGFEPGTPPNGFSTTFAGTGQLEGQINPPGEGQVISPGQWLRTMGPGLSTANVQSAVFAPGGGTQSVQVDRVANSDDRWAVPVNNQGYPDFPNPAPGEPAQPFICIRWDMRVEQADGPMDTFGPFFGVEAYDDDAIRVGLLGSLGVDATTGDVLFQAADTGFLTETGSTVNFNEWNNFQIELDYSTKQYSIFLNNTMLDTIGFVDENNVAGGLNRFTDADIATFAAADDAASMALAGTAYFDNFLVREGQCIPEPSSVLLAAMCLMAGACRARRRG